MGSYVPHSDADRKEMLAVCGFEKIEDLYAHLPEEVKLKDGLDIPVGMSELEVRRAVSSMASKIRFSQPFFVVQEHINTLFHLL